MADKPLCIGVIGGTGVEEALGLEEGEKILPETPFGPPAAPITKTQWEGVDIAVLPRHGQGHVFNPTNVPFRANIFALKLLGVTHIIASGATGSLREHIHPGQIVVVDQIIDKTTRRAGTFYEDAAVHVEMAEPFCPIMRRWLLDAAHGLSDGDGQTITVHDGGTYVCMEGPAFSTRAESHMHRAWGGDLIGMTAMPEAKLAREAEIAYAMIGLPTDYDCWKPHEGTTQDLLSEIIGNLKKASAASLALMKAALRDVSTLRTPSPAHEALSLAVWTPREHIPAEEVERLAPLWGRALGLTPA